MVSVDLCSGESYNPGIVGVDSGVGQGIGYRANEFVEVWHYGGKVAPGSRLRAGKIKDYGEFNRSVYWLPILGEQVKGCEDYCVAPAFMLS